MIVTAEEGPVTVQVERSVREVPAGTYIGQNPNPTQEPTIVEEQHVAITTSGIPKVQQLCYVDRDLQLNNYHWTKDSFKNVLLVWNTDSDYMLHWHFSYAGIAYEVMNRDKFVQKFRKDLDAHSRRHTIGIVDGKDIKNGYDITIRNLVPVLYNEPYNNTWQEKILHMCYSLPLEACENSENWPLVVERQLDKYTQCLVRAFPRLVPMYMKQHVDSLREGIRTNDRMFDNGRVKFLSLKEFFHEFKAEMGSKPFFGGDSPGAIDVCTYVFLERGEWYTFPSIEKLITESQLSTWHSAMKQKMPQRVEETWNAARPTTCEELIKLLPGQR